MKNGVKARSLLVPMKAFQAHPLPSCLPNAQTAISRAAEEVARMSISVHRMEGKGRDRPIPWAHEESQVHVRLQSRGVRRQISNTQRMVVPHSHDSLQYLRTNELSADSSAEHHTNL